MMRLQKYIAKSGYTSRRKAEVLIADGKVKVNGKKVVELGTQVEPSKDKIEVEGKLLTIEEQLVYVLLNKPTGVVSTVSDQFERPTVLSCIKGIEERIYPVGRLDYNTSGLLILTNDGEFTNRVTHPRYHVPKTYLVEAEGRLNINDLEKLRKGVFIDDYKTQPALAKVLKENRRGSIVEITIREGKNRQIRKMFDAINHPVLKLKRIKIGDISDETLKIGSWRHLTNKEITYLKEYKNDSDCSGRV